MAFSAKSNMVALALAVLFVSWSAVINGEKTSSEKEGKAFIFPSNEKIDVKIVNDYAGVVWINVACRSKDDELGVHTLAPQEFFDIRFRPNFWGTTHFWCDVSWLESNGYKNSRTFDAFRGTNEFTNVCKRGAICTWKLNAGGQRLCDNDDKCSP